MRIGVIYPHFEFGSDPAAIKDYAQTAEALGYTHIGADDHIIGPNPDRPGGWKGWVTYKTQFFEPFVLFSFMAGITSKVEFETCVLLLPQRQTVLVAKQAAGLDILCNGRLRLGIGNGWNEIEYISLNQEMRNRGKRLDEQIIVLRKLWTQPLVDYLGKWHNIPDAGINPLPIQRPIPLWFGGQSEAMIERVARSGDGWMPLYNSADEARPGLEYLDRCLEAEGRSRADIGFECRLHYGSGNPDEWAHLIEGWQSVGATHLSLVTTNSGLKSPAEHLTALRRFAEAVGPLNPS